MKNEESGMSTVRNTRFDNKHQCERKFLMMGLQFRNAKVEKKYEGSHTKRMFMLLCTIT